MMYLGKLVLLLSLCVSGYCQGAPPVEARQELVRLLQSTEEPLSRRIAAAEKLTTIRLPGEAILVKVMEESSQNLQRFWLCNWHTRLKGQRSCSNPSSRERLRPRIVGAGVDS